MKTLLSLLLVTGAAHRQAAPEIPLDVMTFNIRYGTADDGENRWEVRKPRTLSVLTKRHPAIIGLQEALEGQVEDITKALPGYEAVGVGRDDGKAKGEFSAIVYDSHRLKALRSDTFWLSETPNVPGSTHWGNRNIRICTWAYFKDLQTGRYFYHFNTHLDHESQNSREKSAALILKKISERITPDPVVISGDFNVGETNPAVEVVKAGGYQDSFRVAHPDEKEVGTFNGWKPTPRPDKIDYVFVGAGWKVKAAEIVHDQVDSHWISDHFPVVTTLIEP